MDTSLPAKKETDFQYLWNKRTQAYDVLDLSTGKIVKKEDFQASPSTVYSENVAAAIVERVLNGDSLAKVARDPDFPSYSAILAWQAAFPEFKKRVDEARKNRAEIFYDKALQLADIAPEIHKDQIPGVKLAIETYKWAAEKNDPDRFAKPKEASVQSGGVTIIVDTGIHRTQVPEDVWVDELGNVHVKGDSNEVQETGRGSGEDRSELNLAEEIRFREVGDEAGCSERLGTEDGLGGRGAEESCDRSQEEAKKAVY